jgi:hypothetical protein
VCNSDIGIAFVLITRLLNPHLVDFTLLPIGVVGVDFGNDVSVHTTGTLSGAQFHSSSPCSALNVDLADFRIDEALKLRVGSIIKSIIQTI